MKSVWLSEESTLLSSSAMLNIQNIADATKLPSSIGRLPHNIQSNLSSFTADQWKNWMLYISLVHCMIYFQKRIWNVGDVLLFNMHSKNKLRCHT